ncbi:ATP-binding protein [Streptomyces sp. NPDC006134]|uniref:ATP-binding protein n=1 Tax=Streptomyces sp. NPDC006134 TaxID=3154467 RepID=UPI00340B8272
MKQSAAKTLGVAALGVAFAAAGAGAANAVPGAPDPGQALDPITRTLPADSLTRTLPGAGEALAQGEAAAEGGLTAAQPTAQQLPRSPLDPVAGLLGGLPANGLSLNGLTGA